MAEASLTGLTPSVRISQKRPKKKIAPKLDFQTCVRPALLEVKPFGTYFNPFGGGCSVLCNHPVETDFRTYVSPSRQHARKIGKRREEKRAAARRGERLVEKMGRQVGGMLERMGAVPDHPTRKCITPSVGHRPTLVLDLRRSHSSDNLTSASHGGEGGKQSVASLSAVTASSAQTLTRTPLPATKEETETMDDGKDDEEPRRRGKKVKKKKKSTQEKTPRQPSVGMIEPNETQVSTYTSEGVTQPEEVGGVEKEMEKTTKTQQISYSPPQCSIFDLATLRHLRRNMAKMDALSEYSKVWRRVLTEAQKASAFIKENENNELNIATLDPDQWINLPRLYSLSTARFQLPLDRNTLIDMDPLEYLRDHVVVAKGKKMLYNHVFIKYSPEEDTCTDKTSVSDTHQVLPTSMPTKMLWKALDEVVGCPLDKEKRENLWQYLDWDESEGTIDLLTWYGLCAFTERTMGKETEGRSYVEEADFELLPRILSTVQPCSDKLTALLKFIHAIGDTTSETTSPDLWKNIVRLQISHVASQSLEEVS